MNTHVKKRYTLIILLVVVITIAVTISAFSLYGYIKDVVINEIGKNAANTSMTIAEFIEQDLDSYKKLYDTKEYKEGTYNKVYYDKMQKLFNKLIKQTGAKYIYTEKRVSDDEIVYILDGKGQVLGVKEKMSKLKIKTYNNEAPMYSEIISDEIWGPIISGFTPIKDNKTGEVYGFIGVDFSLQYIQNILFKVKQVITLVSLLVIFLSSIIAYIIFQRVIDREYMESQQKYKSLADNTPDYLYILDKKGHFIESNPQFETITGYSQSDLINKEPSNLILEEYHRIIDNGIEQTRKGLTTRNDIQIKKKDGTILDVHTTLFPMSINGKVMGTFIYGRDVTKIKETEKMLLKAEKLSVIGELAAGIAHEIRNPLTSIRGLIQLLHSGDQIHSTYYQVILEEVDRINQIVGELLVLAKPTKSQLVKGNIEEVMQSVITLLTPQSNLNGIDMFIKALDPIPEIDCEPNSLKQVFLNMIKNSIEAEAKKIEIKLSKTKDDFVKVMIKDDGCGIDEERIKHLGEPFYSMKEKGTGLGLTVSYKILADHHATIRYFSQLGQGTEIEICLPIHADLKNIHKAT
ncbi:PAS domain S-box protein [Peribacillus asahii]|uniref:histidine kinase n=1 Tax=Peribacillus asahii TaxID=228899 RepID=A0A398AXM7_9BACI|nr:ATP-binding protein [Peribacillus asahii]RID82409.1 PAS domain S-box protein [Peribacillus asahii]